VTEGEVNDLSRDYLKDWRRPIAGARGDGRNDTDPPYDPRPRVYADSVGVSNPEPFDPSTQHGAILSQESHGDEGWRRVDELAQEFGYKGLTDLLNARRTPFGKKRGGP
jgi:hypothetical protein